MTDDRATLQSGASVPAPTSSSTTTMASTFVCNMSLLLKLEIQSGNLFKEWKLWRHVWDAYEEVTDLRIRQIAFASPRLSPVLERKCLKFITVFRSQVKKRNPT